jgi:hypothetical protein
MRNEACRDQHQVLNNGAYPLAENFFLFHWREESQHAIMDELEWIRQDQKLTAEERDQAVDDLIALVAAVDHILQQQAVADGNYFIGQCARPFTGDEVRRINDGILKAYRWQYIVSGVQEPRFLKVLTRLVNDHQLKRIQTALAPIVDSIGPDSSGAQ